MQSPLLQKCLCVGMICLLFFSSVASASGVDPASCAHEYRSADGASSNVCAHCGSTQVLCEYRVTGVQVNVHSSADGPIIGNLLKDELIWVVCVTGDWAEIVYDNAPAYISSLSIRLTSDSDVASAENQPGISIHFVTHDNVTVHDSPSGIGVGKISRGMQVAVVSITDGWAKVVYGEGYGYISISYLQPNSDDSTSG